MQVALERSTSKPSISELSCQALSVSIAGRELVRDLNVNFDPGSVIAILGRNGAGKTLTLHTLAGLRSTQAGEVRLGTESLAAWPRRTLARSLGLLTQTTEDAFPSTVLDAVLVGRHPHIGFWDWESDQDRRIALEALAAVQLQGFELREVSTLSGGERRRVAIAALLTQSPDVYLLDEPINHLDPHHQIDILNLLRTKAADGHSVIMTLHDAALAARFADFALLLFGNGAWHYGPKHEVLTAEMMTKLYGLPVREVKWEEGMTFVMG
jgi:iron complex transport system ATP-binding protein